MGGRPSVSGRSSSQAQTARTQAHAAAQPTAAQPAAASTPTPAPTPTPRAAAYPRPVPQHGAAGAYAQYANQGVYAPRPPMQQQPQQKKKKRGAGFWIGIAIAVICLIVAAVLAFNLLGGGKTNRDGALGQLDGKSPDEIQAELDRVVEEGMFNISIASLVEFADGTSEGELRIENVPGNRYLMQVTITRQDTGEQIYETGVLEPNHHIQSDKLDVDLPAGTYDCTAHFYALDPETEETVGEAAANMTVSVLS